MRGEPATLNFGSLAGPGIDNSQSGCFKLACVSRRDPETVLWSRSSNVSVSLPDRLSGRAAAGHQVRVEFGGYSIKRQNTPVKKQ